MVTEQQSILLQREGRLDLALQAYLRKEFRTPTAAAKAYDIPRTTLLRRINSILPQWGSTSKQRLLTPTEEGCLLDWILSMNRRGMPSWIATVREMACVLVAQRQQLIIQPTVGENWVQRFINRHESIKSKYNQKYNDQRAKCEDPKLIQAWFWRVRDTIAKYGIHEDNIYNFDETGFQMSIISTAKVITGSDQASRSRTTQSGNHKWVTVIEMICVRGLTISSLIIFEAVMHQATWYENSLLSYNWSIDISQNDWTNNEIGLIWLKTVFNKYIKNQTVDQYRLLILDSCYILIWDALNIKAKGLCLLM